VAGYESCAIFPGGSASSIAWERILQPFRAGLPSFYFASQDVLVVGRAIEMGARRWRSQLFGPDAPFIDASIDPLLFLRESARFEAVTLKEKMMPYVITDKCTMDLRCVDACASDAIHPRQDESDSAEVKQLYINPQECMECAVCATECAFSAIYLDSELPSGAKQFAAVNADYFADK